MRTHVLAFVCHVCIDYCFKMLINKTNLPKRGLPDGRALLQAQLFHPCFSTQCNKNPNNSRPAHFDLKKNLSWLWDGAVIT